MKGHWALGPNALAVVVLGMPQPPREGRGRDVDQALALPTTEVAVERESDVAEAFSEPLPMIDTL